MVTKVESIKNLILQDKAAGLSASDIAAKYSIPRGTVASALKRWKNDIPLSDSEALHWARNQTMTHHKACLYAVGLVMGGDINTDEPIGAMAQALADIYATLNNTKNEARPYRHYLLRVLKDRLKEYSDLNPNKIMPTCYLVEAPNQERAMQLVKDKVLKTSPLAASWWLSARFTECRWVIIPGITPVNTEWILQAK